MVSVMSESLQFLDFTSFLSVFLSMLSKILALFTFAALVAAEFPRGSFFIRNVKTGNVVTVRGGSIEPGAYIVLTESTRDMLPEQLWIYDAGFLVNVRSGLFLTIPATGSNMELPIVVQGMTLTQENERKGIDALSQLWDNNFQHLTLFDPRFSVACEDDGVDVVIKRFSRSDSAQQWSFDKLLN